MFPRRYYPGRYFTSRYWPPTTTTTPVEPEPEPEVNRRNLFERPRGKNFRFGGVKGSGHFARWH